MLARQMEPESEEGECSRDRSQLIRERIELSGKLLAKAQHLKHGAGIKGFQRIERKIKAEKNFLESLLSRAEVKEEHMNSSNLLHLEAILHICEHAPAVTAVQQGFCYLPQGTGSLSQSVLVDIVAHEGGTWVRVFARNRKAIHQKWLGDGNYGNKTVEDIARELIAASQQNLFRFETPRIVFAFFDGVTRTVAACLSSLGIEVVGPVFSDESDESAPSPLEVAAAIFKSKSQQPEAAGRLAMPLHLPRMEVPTCDRVNLDISAMIAWTSSITNGGEDKYYDDPMLNEQAKQEMDNPLLPVLLAATEGKELFACKTAVDNFRSILDTIGGPGERQRGEDLLSLLTVVKDEPSDRAMSLDCSAKVKDRTKVVFGTGDTLKAVTLTANEAFVRAAAHQGVTFDVVLHQSRALSEKEEIHTTDR